MQLEPSSYHAEAERAGRTFLVGLAEKGARDVLWSVEDSLAELERLADTAGLTVVGQTHQNLESPHPATYIGSGKVGEVKEAITALDAGTVIFDDELSPAQQRNLEKGFGENVKVLDRTALILDIFAQHASSREGKAQVSLAQMEYMLPRLRGWGESMSRQAGGAGGSASGGVGTRGPGETKIETDRRRIRTKMAKLRREIKEMKTSRDTKRSRRRSMASGASVPSVAIAGYTNAGKSSMLNRLTGAGVLVENALFATLDPTVRRAQTPDGRDYTLVDTVGFVRHLPHQLVEAFRSTLEEVAEADLILHVVDGSDADPEAQLAAVRAVFADVDAHKVPELVVVNKADLADPVVISRLRLQEKHLVVVSARTGEGMDELETIVARELPRPEVAVDVLLPYDRGDLVSRVHDEGDQVGQEHVAEGTRVRARVNAALAAELAPYAVSAAAATA